MCVYYTLLFNYVKFVFLARNVCYNWGRILESCGVMELLFLIILILINAFFAASEMAFISLNDAKIEVDCKNGNKQAIKVKKMLVNPSNFLSTIQIGITLAGFLSSAFAAESFASDLTPCLYDIFPLISYKMWHNISIVFITLILSFFTLVFGELVPKRLAMKNSEAIAYSFIDIIRWISFVMSPFVKLLSFSTNIISSLFGVDSEDEEVVTEEEIRMMVDVGEENGSINIKEKRMINNVFEFNDKTVSEIMVPRTEIYALDINMSIGDVTKELENDYRYSRVPVFEESIDNIKGIVYLKDILLSHNNKNSKIKNLVKEAYYIPTSKPINELFEELRRQRKQIAIVVDEYGGTSGLVTMEDILEEIVGEIYDEYDEEKESYKMVNNNTFIINGNMAIYDVENLLDIKIKDGNYDTISGYLIDKLGRIPSSKEKDLIIEDGNISYKIIRLDDKRITKIKVIKKRNK